MHMKVYEKSIGPNASVFEWDLFKSEGVGESINSTSFSHISASVSGEFHGGENIVFEGSIDGVIWFPLKKNGKTTEISAQQMVVLPEHCPLIRPAFYGESESGIKIKMFGKGV